MERIIAKKRKKWDGFSMLEMLIAIFIFAMIITVTVSVFIASYNGQKKAKEIQQTMEDSRVAIELMAKNIRMGTIDSFAEDEIYFYNYSQNKCIMYKFNNNKIETGEVAGSRVDNANCSGTAATSDLIANPIVDELKFDVTPSDNDPLNLVVGKVTISIKVNDSEEPIQTTVSLRDYVE